MTAFELGLAWQADKPPGGYGELAAAAEAHGFDVVSVFADLLYQPPLPALLEMARATSRVRLGAACLNPFTQHPYEIAGGLALLDAVSPGGRTSGWRGGRGWTRSACRRGSRWRPCGTRRRSCGRCCPVTAAGIRVRCTGWRRECGCGWMCASGIVRCRGGAAVRARVACAWRGRARLAGARSALAELAGLGGGASPLLVGGAGPRAAAGADRGGEVPGRGGIARRDGGAARRAGRADRGAGGGWC